MEERKGLYSSLGKIAWGYALIYLHFNINTIDLLPDWAGWLLIYSALPGIAGERDTCSYIYYFLEKGQISRWHQLKATEVWTWHMGGASALAISLVSMVS